MTDGAPNPTTPSTPPATTPTPALWLLLCFACVGAPPIVVARGGYPLGGFAAVFSVFAWVRFGPRPRSGFLPGCLTVGVVSINLVTIAYCVMRTLAASLTQRIG